MRDYLKTHYISFNELSERGVTQFVIAYKAMNTPDGILEACIWFYPEYMECRVYYSEYCSLIVRSSSHQNELMRLLNYINACVWPHSDDGYGSKIYKSSYLYTPRIYMVEDGSFDISLTMLINYDFYELAELETEDFITLICPELMDELSAPVFSLLFGEMSFEDAKSYIDRAILGL